MERLAYIKGRLKETQDHFQYMKVRYNLDFCLLLLETKDRSFLEDFVKQIRKSDRIIDIEEGMVAFFFHLLSLEDYERVIDKLLEALMQRNVQDFHIGISCSDKECEGGIVVRAYQNLKKAMDERKEVVDEF